jgi:uncharacterized protein (DUF58 family)
MVGKMADTFEKTTSGSAARPYPSHSAGCLLSTFGLLVVLAGLILSAWYNQVVIVIILSLLLSAGGLSNLWSRFSLTGVSCERWLSERRVFPGEYIELRLLLVNRKPLPLPWIQIEFETPLKMSTDTPPALGDSVGPSIISKSTALLWYTKVVWKESLYCHKRGYYRLGPTTMTSGDIFGFYPRSATRPMTDYVIVYPKIYPVAQLGIPSLYPLGETAAEWRIFEDPTRVIGVRDYDPRDSRRHIHWKATARRQELQVKVFEPTTTLKVAIFLAVDTFRHDGITNEEDLELGISTAASIANYLVERRNSVGMFVNSCLADSGQPVTLLPGSQAGQLVEILEALAKVTPLCSSPFEHFLQAERVRLPWGTTFLFILSETSPILVQLFTGLKESGHRMAILQTGGTAGSDTLNTITRYHVRCPEDLTLISGKT